MFFWIRTVEALSELYAPQDRAGPFAVVSRRRGGSRLDRSLLARHETQPKEVIAICPQPSTAAPTD